MTSQERDDPWNPVGTDDSVLIEDGLRKAIAGYTWPGIEYGEPPSCAYTFFEYIDALRFGNLEKFKMIEEACKGWWFPTLDRGLGAALHFAVDHGQLRLVKFLIEERNVEVNQRALHNGWTPLHRCARVAHYHNKPHLEAFEYLLQKGADPAITSYPDALNPNTGEIGPAFSYVDAAAEKGRGWEWGEVRAKLQELCEKYKDVPKKPAYQYDGPTCGKEAWRVLKLYEALPKLYPPDNWRPPPPAGFELAQGWRRHSLDPWRKAGDNDGSQWIRQMTPKELDEQDRLVAEEAKRNAEEAAKENAVKEAARAALAEKFRLRDERIAAARAAQAAAAAAASQITAQ